MGDKRGERQKEAKVHRHTVGFKDIYITDSDVFFKDYDIVLASFTIMLLKLLLIFKKSHYALTIEKTQLI